MFHYKCISIASTSAYFKVGRFCINPIFYNWLRPGKVLHTILSNLADQTRGLQWLFSETKNRLKRPIVHVFMQISNTISTVFGSRKKVIVLCKFLKINKNRCFVLFRVQFVYFETVDIQYFMIHRAVL